MHSMWGRQIDKSKINEHISHIRRNVINHSVIVEIKLLIVY